MSHARISYVIPMYNEKEAITHTVRELTRIALGLSRDFEIIISDDASTDGSGEVAEELARNDPRIKVVRLEKNTKFGGALRAGIEQAQKDIIVYTDSDLPVTEKNIKEALAILISCDIVTACSTVKKGETFTRVIMSRVYNFLIDFLFGTKIKDINSGLKLFKREIFEGMSLASNSPFVDVEIFVKAKRKNAVIKQYPIVFRNRERGESYISKPAVVLRTILDMLRFKCQRG